MPWQFKKYGTATDPIHKSDLNSITGDYGCDRQFRFYKDAEADGAQAEQVVGGKAACGNALHETIRRALSNVEVRDRLLSGKWQIDRKHVDPVFREELDREIGGREINWYDDNADKIIADRASMIVGAMNDLHKHVAEIVLLEAGFIVRLDGYWLSGHIDMLYRPKSLPIALAIADWKSGASKPDQIELDHGWEAGIYSAAVHAGAFMAQSDLTESELAKFARDRRKALEAALVERALNAEAGAEIVPTFGEFPAEIWHVHLQDYVPYQKAGSKECKRPEDCKHYGVEAGTKIKYIAGQTRGPAWLPVRRTEHDIPRLSYQLRNVVGTIRMGRFAERIGEKCKRCPFREPCLNAGYAPRGAEQRELERRLQVLGNAELFDGLDEAV